MTTQEILNRLRDLVEGDAPKLPFVASSKDAYVLGWDRAMEEIQQVIYDADPSVGEANKSERL